jgi:hypothetical protein
MMALLWMDGFDLYGTNGDAGMQSNGRYSNNWSNVSTSTTLGRFSGGALTIRADDYAGFGVTPSGDTIYFQGAFKLLSVSAAREVYEPIIAFYTNGGRSSGAEIQITQSGALRIIDANTVQQAISDSRVLFSYSWHFIEAKCVGGASGTLVVKIDGNTVINVTMDTQPGSYTQIDDIKLFSPFSSTANYVYWDDIAVFDNSGAAPLNDFIGDARITTLLPNADDTQSDWTRNTGSNDYEAIDDPIPGANDTDTTYISATTATHKSLFEFENSSTPEIVYALAAEVEAKKTDAGAKSMRAYVDSNSTIDTGDTWNVTTDYLHWQYIWPLNPDTSTAWTKTTVDAVKAGVEVVS